MGSNRLRARARLRLAALGAILLLACGTTSLVERASAGSHPLYDDGGTLRWYATLTEARAAAAREGKLVLVDVSLENCRTCRMVIGIIPDRQVAARLSRVAVGYHVNARSGTVLARDFRGNLRSAAYLPWVGFFTPEQTWVTGFAPSKRVTRVEMRRRFLLAIGTAEAELRSRAAARNAASVRSAPAAAPVMPAPIQPTPVRPAPVQPMRRAEPRPRRRTTPRSGRLVWYRKFSKAQAAARAEGKIIFVASTKPGCSLCKKLKEQIAPQCASRLGQGAVGYFYDITNPESVRVDSVVRANLKGAYLMPLCGFVTPDLRWLHGFFGSTSVQKLTADYETAMRKR